MPGLSGATPARLRLVDDTDELVIRPVPAGSGDPVVCREWDPGAPQVREVVRDRITLDGTADDSAYIGSRTVTLELSVFGDAAGSAYAYAERLTSFAHPARRPFLYVSRHEQYGGDEWRLLLRGNPFSITYARKAAAVLELTLAFTAPDGVFESPLRSVASVAAGPTDTGLLLPSTVPLSFGLSTAPLGALLNVHSPAPVAPTVFIYGPTADPEAVLDNGQRFRFTGLDLGPGRFVAINMAAGTVRLDGNPAGSVYHLVDWSVSTFWLLRPGLTQARLTTPGQLIVQWRDRRLTI